MVTTRSAARKSGTAQSHAIATSSHGSSAQGELEAYQSKSAASDSDDREGQHETPDNLLIPRAGEDTLAYVDEISDDEEGEICELHVYERRYNSKGVSVTVEVGAMDRLPTDLQLNPLAALVLVRYYNTAKELTSTLLEIRSPYMKKALKEVIGSYPEVNIGTEGAVQISGAGAPHCIFHYRHELEQYAETSEDEDIKEHVGFMLNYMGRAMRKELNSWKAMMERNQRTPGLAFDDLWMAFRPGDLLYLRDNGLQAPILMRLRKFEMTRVKGSHATSEYWTFHCDMMDCDGDNVLSMATATTIHKYQGYRALDTLEAFPLKYHKDEAQVRKNLLQRGKRWLALTGKHHRSYAGTAGMIKFSDCVPPFSSEPYSPPNSWMGNDIVLAHGRIMIDFKEFTTNVETPSRVPVPGGPKVKVSELRDDSLTDDEILLCKPTVYAFSMVAKRWGVFLVDNIKEVEYNKTAFDDLIIPQAQKSLIRSLVNDHAQNTSTYDDIIEGKGKGLIFLLHGPPGVGKTLTAESLADSTQRPLYTLGCGELSTSTVLVEKTLKRALELANRWNALVLIDEADVFMEQRDSHDLKRNELVSILLRVLEYFQGVMFLTTNRVSSIDSAFKSRIHLSLYYPHLSPSARTTIWKSQITRASASAWLNAGFMDRLTAYDINGRQIKNTVRMACSLAANEKREVCEVDILRGLKAWTEFEVDFGIERRTRIKRLGSALSRMRRGMRSYMWAKVMLVCKFPTHLPNRFFRGRSRRSPGRSRPG